MDHLSIPSVLEMGERSRNPSIERCMPFDTIFRIHEEAVPSLTGSDPIVAALIWTNGGRNPEASHILLLVDRQVGKARSYPDRG